MINTNYFTLKFPDKYHNIVTTLRITYSKMNPPSKNDIIRYIIYHLRSENIITLEQSKELQYYFKSSWYRIGSNITLIVTNDSYKDYHLLLELILTLLTYKNNILIQEGTISSKQNLKISTKFNNQDPNTIHLTISDYHLTKELFDYNHKTLQKFL